MDKKKLESIKLILDDNNHVSSFSTIGAIDGAIEYCGPIPTGFLEDVYPQRYLLSAGVLVEDPQFMPPTIPKENGPSLLEQLNQTKKELAKSSYQLMAEQQKNSLLAKQQAQLSFEMMQVKKQLQGGESHA